jgi:hypothetical protein
MNIDISADQAAIKAAAYLPARPLLPSTLPS